MLVGIHCEVEPRWVIGSFEGLFGYQKVFSSAWNRLSEHLLTCCKADIMSILISLAATQHWPFHQLDVKNAFLNSVLDEEDYMKQPPGFIAQEESGKVCRLKKSLYELKQSLRAWFGQFASVIRSFSFSERSLYILSTASRKEVTSYSG